MLLKKIYRYITSEKWTIGFVNNKIDDIINGKELDITWIRHKFNDRWFADPFVLDVDEKYIYVLVEEYYRPIHRAYISKLTIDKKTKELIKTDLVLKLNTHLSYPAIIRKDNHIYIYPESGQSGRLMLYEYFPESNEVREKECLIDGDVGDATYTKIFGEDMIFCTVAPKYNDNELHVFRKDSAGKYFDSEIIYFKDNVARMAGDFFTYHDKIYRPAQDCNKNYGNGTVIQEIKHENGTWKLNEIVRYYSTNKRYPLAFHTLNSYKDVIVVDAQGFWFHSIGTGFYNLKNHIKNLIHK